jgi:hypothetical protein
VILYIKPSNEFDFDVLLDEKSFFLETPFTDKAKLLGDAITALETDIQNLAKSVDSNRYYNFFWEFTYDIHRDDGIRDTVADYYLLEILSYINKKYKIEKVEIHYFLPKPVINKISSILPVSLKYSKKYLINNYIRYQLGPLKYLVSNFFKSFLRKRGSKGIEGKNNVVCITNNYFSTVRYKDFPTLLSKKFNVYLLNISLTKMKNHLTKKEIRLNSYSIRLYFKSFFKSLKQYNSFHSTLKKIKNPSVFSLKLKKQSFLQTFYVVLRYETLKKIFSTNKFKYVITITTIGEPLMRMVCAVARVKKIKTIVFSCRYFLSNLRAEDRIIKLDFSSSNGDFFTDFFISFDKISKNHLMQAGVNINSIYTYNEEKKENEQKYINNGIVLLFSSPPYNDKLLTLFETAVKKGFKFENVYYREHPNKGISEEHMKRFKNIFKKNICLNKYKWVEITFINVLAFSSNSTSGIDASSRGASIIWLPFLTEQSIQFKPMMDAIGEVCYDENEFLSFIESLYGKNRTSFNKKCKTEYQRNIYEKSSMPEFLDRIA